MSINVTDMVQAPAPAAGQIAPAAIKEGQAATDSEFAALLALIVGSIPVPGPVAPTSVTEAELVLEPEQPEPLASADLHGTLVAQPILSAMPDLRTQGAQNQVVFPPLATPEGADHLEQRVSPISGAGDGVDEGQQTVPAVEPRLVPVPVTVTLESRSGRNGFDEADRLIREPGRAPMELAAPLQSVAERPTTPPTAQTPARIQTPIEPERLMESISRSVASSQPGRYAVTLHLHPEHLGEVRLKLNVIGREVVTVLEVSTTAAKHALEQRGEELRQGLREAGLTLCGFEVNTGQGGQTRQQELLDALLWERRRNRTTGSAAAAPIAGAATQVAGSRKNNGRLDTLA